MDSDVQAVENFLRLARGAQTKDDFISRVRQFDQKFIDAYPSPLMAPLPSIPRSNSQSGMSVKPSVPESLKNPFLNTADEKLRMQRQPIPPVKNQQQQQQQQQQPQQQFMQKPLQQPMLRNRGVPIIPHSRSEVNFYRQEDEGLEDFSTHNTFANQFYNNEDPYRQGSLSYLQPPEPRPRTTSSQPYIQQNEFLPSYEAEEPDYVKYYKKMVPQTNPKLNYSQTPRANPFKI